MSERENHFDLQPSWPLAKDVPIDRGRAGTVFRAFIVGAIVGAISGFFLGLIAFFLPFMFTRPGPGSDMILVLVPLVVTVATASRFFTGGIYGVIRALRNRW